MFTSWVSVLRFNKSIFWLMVAVFVGWFMTLAIIPKPVQASHVVNTSVYDRSNEFGPLRLKQGSNFKAALEINFGSNENSKTFTSATVCFTATSGSPTWTNMAATSSELLNLATINGGISLWKETGVAGQTGPNPFNSSQDTQITLAANPTYGASNCFTITPATPPTIATDDAYYVVLKTKTSGVTNNNAFTLTAAANSIVTSGSSPTITLVTTQSITIDTTVPTLSSSAPANGATNVPIHVSPRLTFSEDVDPATINPANITLTRGTTVEAFGVRPFPNGFETVFSSSPTFVSGSRFARPTISSHSFFPIPPPGGTIVPGGDYRSIIQGDIVFTQQGNFAPRIDLVTNPTLTSGIFSVNDVPLNLSQEITLLATPTATGLCTASTSVTAGDFIVINTTANPTSQGYDWHLVTTGGAMNGSALRLDGASSAPTCATGSRFSTMTPTDTSAVDAMSQVVGSVGGGINLQAGDLIFARITAGGDNSNSYAWHLVTTAENFTTDTGPSALRLDLATSAPTLAANSRISILRPANQGPVTDTTTQFNVGDLMFAKTTAGSATNNIYTFHMVSGGATGASNINLRLDNVTTPLLTGSTYTLTANTGVTDKAGNQLAALQTVTFTTGSTGETNVTPPQVRYTLPGRGTHDVPTNMPIKVAFSVAMKTSGEGSVLNSVGVGAFQVLNGTPQGAPITAANTYDSSTNTLTITPGSALPSSTDLVLKIDSTVQSATGVVMAQPYLAFFRTGSGADTTKPTVLGISPANGATSVLRNAIISLGFSENMNPDTINLVNLTISPTVSGTWTYDPGSRRSNFTLTASLAASTAYTVNATTSVTDLVGNALDQDPNTNGNQSYTASFTTGSTADTAAPIVASANADNFNLVITFSEAMKSGGGPNAADNLANYLLESPVGTSISLAGKTITYEGATMTARITGLSLTVGATYKVTVSAAAQDLSGNAVPTAGTPPANEGQGIVANSSTTGGQIGPGGGAQPSPGMEAHVDPRVRAPGVTSDYFIGMPLSTSIPLGGSIVLTFPLGFDVSGVAAKTAANSTCNADLNGPFTGVVTIAGVAANTTARTITVTTAGAATGASGVCFELTGIVNSTIPSTTGYTVDIKTRDTTANSSAILESKTSAPFFLGQAGTRSLTVNVFEDNGAGGGTANNNTKDGTEPGIANAVITLFNPGSGGLEALTNAGGVATFPNLSDGQYMFMVDPEALVIAGYTIDPRPEPLSITADTTKNVGLRLAPYTISGTITGPANTALDVIANSLSGFMVRSVNTGAGGSVNYTLPAQGSSTYQLCVGPAMPDDMRRPGSAAPPPPVFTFMPPPCQSVNVVAANVAAVNFTIVATNKTITGVVRDASGTGISDVGIFARPVAETTGGGSTIGFGTGSKTDSSGNFTLNVVTGVYEVGVHKPGMPLVSSQQITVPATGANTPLTLTFRLNSTTSGLTIRGTVKGSNDLPIPYAGVGGRRVVSITDQTPTGGGPENFIGGPTDAQGIYTLYVTAGTWVVEAFAPEVGQVGRKILTISTASLTGQDFVVSSTTRGTVTGQATRGGTAQKGVHIRAEGTNGQNMAVTNDTGNYTLNLPAGTYTITCFFPGFGESAPLTGVIVTANANTANQNCALGSPITITVNLTDGTNAVSGGFVEGVDANGRRNGIGESTTSGANAVYILNLPPGTYTIRAGHPSYGLLGTTTSVSTTQTITYTATSGVRRTVSGAVTASGNPVELAWVSLTGMPTGQTNIIHTGGQTDVNGAYSLSVPAGSYKLRGDKPNYTSSTEQTVTVSTGNLANQNLILTAAARTITVTVTLSGAGVSNAFVDASNGTGGYAVCQTNPSGICSLAVNNGTWSIRAHSHGYGGGPVSAAVSGADISAAVSLSAISGFTLTEDNVETITPSSGAQIKDANIGANFKVNVPANALGNSANAATVTTKVNTAVPNPPTGFVLQKNAVQISAVSASAQPITSLGEEVTVTLPYTETDLPAGTAETSLVVGRWNESTSNYDTLPTTVDTVNNTLTAVTDHLSDFAPLVPTDPSAPATPIGLAATNFGSQTVLLTWNASTGASSYNIYRSTDNLSFPLLTSAGTTSSTLTNQAASTTFYYKVSAVNVASNESAASSAVPITPTGGTAGGTSGGGSVLPSSVLTLTLTSPNGGEKLDAAASFEVKWTSSGTGLSTIRLLLSGDGGLNFSTTVATGEANDGKYTWTVPSIIGLTFRLRIEGYNSQGQLVISDLSDSDFQIKSAGAVEPAVPAVPKVSPAEPAIVVRGKPISAPVATPGLDRAGAVILQNGDRIMAKGSNTVYLYTADGKRHAFFNETQYQTWFSDFRGVKVIPVDQLSTIPLGRNMLVRSGTWLIKITSDPKVYAVEPTGVIRWVQTEEIATSLYGSNWNKRIIDVDVSRFVDYLVGSPIMDKTYPDGSLISDDTGTHYVLGGKRRRFSAAERFGEMGYQTQFVLPVSDILAKPGVATLGSPISTSGPAYGQEGYELTPP